MFTANGKLEMQVENFFNLGKEQIKTTYSCTCVHVVDTEWQYRQVNRKLGHLLQ